jgi:ketosteroid isomerase-like protein
MTIYRSSRRPAGIRLIVLLLAVLAGGAVKADDAAEVARIEKLYADYRAAVESGSIPGYLEVLHPRVRLLPPGAEAIVGAEHYAGFLEPVFATAEYRIEVVQPPAIEVLDGVAIAEYVYVIHISLRDPEVGITQEGALKAQRTVSRYFDVLRRTAGGDWAIWRHTWTALEES